MKVIFGIGQVKRPIKNAVLAIGVFDGLHKGHQALIKKIVREARRINGRSVVMTFDPHPVHVLSPDTFQPLIISLEYRLKLIEQLGADHCLVVRFSKKFAGQSPEQFVKNFIADKIAARKIFVGEDFRFGHDRSGTLKEFSELGNRYGFTVHSFKPLPLRSKDPEKIGSTSIRQLILAGDLKQAKKLLGREVSIMGKVVKGDARGKTLGFPTANIFPENNVIPPLGVYAVNVLIGSRKFKGMANVGKRPSFKPDNGRVNIEAHIFRFNENLYNKTIIVEFCRKLRDEKRFSSREDLIAQLKKDAVAARRNFPSKVS